MVSVPSGAAVAGAVHSQNVASTIETRQRSRRDGLMFHSTGQSSDKIDNRYWQAYYQWYRTATPCAYCAPFIRFRHQPSFLGTTSVNWLKPDLTYCVPYAVCTYGAVSFALKTRSLSYDASDRHLVS